MVFCIPLESFLSLTTVLVVECDQLWEERGEPTIQVDRTPYCERLTLGRYQTLQGKGERSSVRDWQ